MSNYFLHWTRFIMSSHQLLLGLLAVVLLKGLVTTILVPVWEFPDEQAHFAQVAYYVETGTQFENNDVSEEIYRMQQAMGTVRDEWGINQYTYRAHFRPAYSDNINGVYEWYVKSLDNSTRTNYVKKEAARYQPLFYHLSSLGYRATYDQDIISRIFATRFISVILAVGSAAIAYGIGWRLFGNQLYASFLAILISFQPMFSFVSAGANNDNLLNLFGLLLLYLVLDIFHQGLNWRNAFIMGVVAGLGLLTKPLILPVLLPIPLLLIWEWYRSRRSLRHELQILLPTFILSLISGGYLLFYPLVVDGRLPFITNYKEYSPYQNLSFIDYIKPQLGRYYRETLVWYWGVFKWLGVILPLNVVRLIKIVMGLSGLGLIWYLIRPQKWIKLHQVVILFVWAFVYVAAITLWDFDMVRKNGISHGLQGRYFFPTIGAHMGLLLIGFMSLHRGSGRKWLGLFLSLGMICLHLISLWTIASSYYDLSSVRLFFTQLSQYKPIYFKYPFALVWLVVYVLALISLVTILVSMTRNFVYEKKQKSAVGK